MTPKLGDAFGEKSSIQRSKVIIENEKTYGTITEPFQFHKYLSKSTQCTPPKTIFLKIEILEPNLGKIFKIKAFQ